MRKKVESINGPSGYQAPAVQKAFQILNVVAESKKGLGLSELAHMLGFSKSSTHGLIQALVMTGSLEEDPQKRKYYLGPTLVELAFRSWNYLRVTERAQPMLEELRDRIGETIFLGVLSKSRGVIVATADALKPLKISSPPGTSIPLLAGAVGKAFLADLNGDQAKRIIEDIGLHAYTKKTITTPAAYLEELKRVRQQGYALDDEEYLPGVRAVAVSLGNQRGLPLAIWVVGFADAINDQTLSSIVEFTLLAANKLKTLLDNSA